MTPPVHVLPGNHDRRAELRAAFDLPGAADAPIAYAATAGPLRLVCADTIIPGTDAGRIDVAAIAAQLATDPETPTILAMHHAPLVTGIPVMDALGVPAADRAALADLLARSPQVRRVICGHVHRTAVGVVGGCPVLTLSSTLAQERLDFAAADFAPVAEPPLLAVHRLLDGELVSHLQPV